MLIKKPSDTESSLKEAKDGLDKENQEPWYKGIIETYPKQIYIGMVAMIIVSFLVVFLVVPEQNTAPKIDFFEKSNQVQSDFMDDYSTVKDISKRSARILELKSEIERIISQEVITEEDSIIVEKAILELEYFNNQKEKQNEN